MTRFILKDRTKKILMAVVAICFWLALWQLAYIKVAQELLLVSPAQAFARLLALSLDVSFWRSLLETCLRVVTGFLCALIIGIVLAAASVRFKLVYAIITPLLGVVRATPVASFIILALLWVRADNLPVFIAFLMVVPMICANISAGIMSVDKDLLEMSKIFKLSRAKIFSAIYMPAIMPHFVSACTVGLGFAWKSAIAAEVICLPKMAVGKKIYDSKIYLETADLFAWTIAVIILSVLIEKLTLFALQRVNSRLFSIRRGEKANA